MTWDDYAESEFCECGTTLMGDPDESDGLWRGKGERAEAFKANLGQNVLYPKRLGTPGELASMVVELLTNDYMNGEVIRVDGGIRMPPR